MKLETVEQHILYFQFVIKVFQGKRIFEPTIDEMTLQKLLQFPHYQKIQSLETLQYCSKKK